jgi:CDP-diacylglycerol--serine O-phosphatidyltransferase
MKKHIPNFITCLNLFSGCVASYLAFKSNYEGAFIAILLAAVFDFMDGFAARLLKAYSAMGKELDSLADMISFGLAPGAIIFSLLTESGTNEWLPFAGFLIPVFSGLRLAKFNIDDRQTSSFLGLPVPANAIFWAGIVYSFSPFLTNNTWFFLILIGVFCFLLVSEIPMFSLKFKNVSWRDNQNQYFFLIGCVAILAIFQLSAFALIISWYIASSLGIMISKKFK